jgi:hypothetical protein
MMGSATSDVKWITGLRRTAGTRRGTGYGHDWRPDSIDADTALLAVAALEETIASAAALSKRVWLGDLALAVYVAVGFWPIVLLTRSALYAAPLWLPLWAVVGLGCVALVWPSLILAAIFPAYLRSRTQLRRGLFSLTEAIRNDDEVGWVVLAEIGSDRAPGLASLTGGRSAFATSLSEHGHT